MTKSGKKYLLFSIIAVVLIIIVVLVVKKSKSKEAQKVSVEKVEKRTLIQTVSANGQIEPAVNVKISPYISGEVVNLYVKEGDYVTKGQKLAKIDPKIYISAYQQSKASTETAKANQANMKAKLSEAQAQFIKAQLDYNRSEKLWKSNVISASDYDAAKANFSVAKSTVKGTEESYKASQFQVKNAEAQLQQAEDNLNRTTIYAPNNGTVSQLNVEVGERVTGASQFSSGTEIMSIANLDVMEATVEVNENDIVQVALNDTAIIEVDAYLDHPFKGIVTQIATSANTTGTSVDQVTNFDVKIRILKSSYTDLIKPKNPIPSPFRPGMSATVDIQTQRADNVLSVPIQAVTTRSTEKKVALPNSEKRAREKMKENKTTTAKEDVAQAKTQEYVFLYDNGVAKLQKVKTGIQNNMYIEILEGLKAGQEVITAPYELVSKKLKNGEEVKKVSQKELFSSH
ncbi:MAG: efflux RND transporter periplasmic adaptor subunit [Bacteroidales bacterium]|nr:efflux RND transporter periplasmic adaptor subunit [Bacteroidales bacterium]